MTVALEKKKRSHSNDMTLAVTNGENIIKKIPYLAATYPMRKEGRRGLGSLER
jgi:hypothetical protein